MDSGRILRQARHRAGLTQRELAERAGVPQPAIARIESNRVEPRVETLDRLLRICGERLDAVAWSDGGVDRSQIRERLSWNVGERLEEVVSAANTLRKIRVLPK
jgi:hypothetical protein